LAKNYIRRERADHTLQPTALLNEAYLKLVGSHDMNWRNRAHFFAIAARMMRHILVDHARKGNAGKRGAGIRPIALDEAIALTGSSPEALLALNAALERLERMDPRQVEIIELRFFAGLSVDETADALAISSRTVGREWKVAQAWLRKELGQS
jgi:RNA polymerase sigma factor (TIGR02999 family)